LLDRYSGKYASTGRRVSNASDSTKNPFAKISDYYQDKVKAPVIESNKISHDSFKKRLTEFIFRDKSYGNNLDDENGKPPRISNALAQHELLVRKSTSVNKFLANPNSSMKDASNSMEHYKTKKDLNSVDGEHV